MFDKIITTNTTETKPTTLDTTDDVIIELLEEIVARLEVLEKKDDKSKEFCGCGKQIK